MSSRLRLLPVIFVAAMAVLAGSVSVAAAEETPCSGCRPWWGVSVGSLPRNLPPGGEGQLTVLGENRGDAALGGSPVVLKDRLPQGLAAQSVALGFSADQFGDLSTFFATIFCKVETHEVTCTIPAEFLPSLFGTVPYTNIEAFIGVRVAGATSGEVNEASVSGGGASSASSRWPIVADGAPTPFGVEQYELGAQNADGSMDTQAGSHPFQLTSVLALNQTADASAPPAALKDLHFDLPPGLIGNPTPFPQCSDAVFASLPQSEGGYAANGCPDDTVVGVASVTVQQGLGAGYAPVTYLSPLFSLVPSVGEPARFGFDIVSTLVYLDTSVRTGGDYGVQVNVNNITELTGFISSRVTFWGVPGDPRHDSVRGWNCLNPLSPEPHEFSVPSCNATSQESPPPLLSLPTSCAGQVHTSVAADSWEQEGAFTPPFQYTFQDALGRPMGMDGCNQLPFTPSIQVSADGAAGSTPTGLTVGIHVPQEVSLNGQGLSEADVKDTKVILPAGVALNPAAADGLLSCSEAQIGLQEDAVPSCPEASKVATVEIKSPLLPNPLVGGVYLAAQNQNPFGSLVALYLVAEDPVSGVLVKVAGEVTPDPVTGQLVSTFLNTPQLPFEDLKLHFFGGDRAPLGTPAACGAYTTTTSIAPWSGNASAEPSSTFDITSGPNGSPCQSPAPFGPSLTAGTTSIQAGGFTPFTMTVSREDGQQNIQGIQLHMPAGLSGLLTGIELCGEAQADAGTCGPNSLIGETTVSVGLGGDPYSVTGGKVYITGPYEGAPFGISVVVPAKAGPYNLGQVVVRGTIAVNPITAALTVTTNSQAQGYAIPHILDGIPLQIKHVNFTTTRSGFTFNPTNCGPMEVTGDVASAQGASSNVSVPFQVTNCAILAFKPGFAVSTSGKTSRTDGASLHVKLSYPKAAFGSQANIKSVKVDLPRQLPSRLTTLQKACPAKTFEANPAGCPSASIVGHATAITPLIPVPLTGPAYFVSYGGAKFPELVVVLQGYGVTLNLHGETFINTAGITSSTFRTIPDAPVGSFELTLPEGKYSALGANKNLCKVKGGLKMPTAFTAQNGAVIKQSTPVGVSGCPKAKAKTMTAKKASKGHKKK
ncbi:MAG TPA: hypothetical protein VK691_13305 [Solirubrobacteraceae bacterium]|nr:hypothetical protein [Solirubrobacteraceae bacterium]